MTDLVERLRELCDDDDEASVQTMLVMREAADDITRLRSQLASIEACCETTLIGFQDKLGERNIAFICDQIARKVRIVGGLVETDE